MLYIMYIHIYIYTSINDVTKCNLGCPAKTPSKQLRTGRGRLSFQASEMFRQMRDDDASHIICVFMYILYIYIYCAYI